MPLATVRRPGVTRRCTVRPGRRGLPGLPAVALVLAAALPGGASPASAAVAAPGAASSTDSPLVPVPGQSSDLFAVACPSSSDCWAAGRYQAVNGAELNQVLNWNGAAWSLAATPDPGGTSGSSVNALFGAACTLASNCWAVGYYLNGSGTQVNEALHWNGTRWSLVPTPQPGSISEIQGVRCTSASNCWAVGAYRNGSGATLNQALHWNGTKWSLVSTPPPGGTTSSLNHTVLNFVGCASASNCWAVGYDSTAINGTAPILNELLHWDG